MDDIVLVTADSVRHDYVDAMEFVSSFDPAVGVTAGHYTRPSLAGLHSGSLLGVVRSRIAVQSLAETLSEGGYTCIGLAPSAQLDPAFGFDRGFTQYENYAEGSGNRFQNRRSSLREFLGGIDLLRDIYYRVFPMEALLSDLPPDAEVIERAIEAFNEAEPPRFLWVHLMGTHRPYGRGETALPTDLDRKAAASGSGLFSKRMTDSEHETIEEHYRAALKRTDSRIEQLIEDVETDPVFVFTSDHGDELGEEGYYYHQGYRRRVVEPITHVPVGLDGLDLSVGRLSLLDIAPTLAAHAGVAIPESWQGNNLAETETAQTVTIAPWHNRATVMWQDFTTKIVAEDATVSYLSETTESKVGQMEVTDEIEQRLQALGYADAG